MSGLFFLPISYFLTRLLLPWGLKTMEEHGVVKKNYQEIYIPTPAGLVPVAVYLVLVAYGTILFKDSRGLIVFILCLLLTCLGLLDDWKGDSSYKGLKGHFKALCEGRITTGASKAIGGGLLSIIGAYKLANLGFLLINALLVALATNSFNLLDLRPGRALKVFLGIALIIIWFQKGASPYWLFALVGATLAFLPWDLYSKGMLGDTGANILGFTLGLAIIISLTLPAKIIILVVLFGFHFYTERYSLSQLIEEIPFLNYLDRLGRPEH